MLSEAAWPQNGELYGVLKTGTSDGSVPEHSSPTAESTSRATCRPKDSKTSMCLRGASRMADLAVIHCRVRRRRRFVVPVQGPHGDTTRALIFGARVNTGRVPWRSDGRFLGENTYAGEPIRCVARCAKGDRCWNRTRSDRAPLIRESVNMGVSTMRANRRQGVFGELESWREVCGRGRRCKACAASGACLASRHSLCSGPKGGPVGARCGALVGP